MIRTLKYVFIQSLYWMGFGASSGFAAVYLLEQGFTNFHIGVIFAIAGIISTVIQPPIAANIDNSIGKNLKPWLVTLSIIPIIGAVFAYLCFKGNPFLSGIAYSIGIVCIQALMPLVNSIGVGKEPKKGGTNFGFARACGSLFYAIFVSILGFLVDDFGIKTILGSMALIYALLIVSVIIFPYVPLDREEKRVSQGSFLRRYPRFASILVGMIFVYISHVLINNYTYQIVIDKGWDSVVMGNSKAISAVVELPVLFFFASFLKKKPAAFWFKTSGIGFLLKTFGTFLAHTITSFYIVQLFQSVGWALIAVSAVIYIKDIMPPEDAVKGQSYATMTYTLATILAALVGGVMIDALGINNTLIFGSVCAAIGWVIFLVTVK